MVNLVSSYVLVNGSLVEPVNGRVGILKSEDKVRLEVSIDERAPHVVAFIVNEHSNALAVEARHNVFVRNVGIKPGRNGNAFVGYPTNHLCVALLMHDGGVMIIKTGLVTQGKVTYLTTYESSWDNVQLFHDQNGQVRCPRFENEWQTLTKVLCEGFAEHKEMLPTLPDGYTLPQEQLPALPHGDNAGMVSWFELLRGVGGTGALRTHHGEVRVQSNAAPAREGGLHYLKRGEAVAYQDLVPTQGKTTFKFDAQNVKLL